MRSLYLLLISVLSFICCTKHHTSTVENVEDNKPAPYDTIAVDSFSKGAISSEIARKIRISSKGYQDSLAIIKQKAEEERKKLEETAKIEKAAKEALDKENATKEAQKNKAKEEKSISTAPLPVETPPSSN